MRVVSGIFFLFLAVISSYSHAEGHCPMRALNGANEIVWDDIKKSDSDLTAGVHFLDIKNCILAAHMLLMNGPDGNNNEVFEVQYRYFEDEDGDITKNLSGVLRKSVR